MGIVVTSIKKKEKSAKVEAGNAGTLTIHQLDKLAANYHDNWQALNFAGVGFFQHGEFHRSAELHRKSLKLHPKNPGTYNSLGNSVRSLGEYTRAIKLYDKGLELKPNDAGILLNRSLANLALGNYREAWGDYENRLQIVKRRSEVLNPGKPRWNGERMSREETLFIYGNQGLGDELMCFRFLTRVTELVENVILEVQEPLFGLMQAFPGIKQVRSYSKNSLPYFDKHVEIFSLPGIFGIEVGNIPLPTCPPFAQDGKIKAIIKKARSREDTRCRHIGLVWSGNPKNEVNRFRACGLQSYLPLLSVSNCRFYSLQKGTPEEELTSQPNLQEKITNLAPHLSGMRATATAIQELDLVISVDTSIPHLTGTIREPGWVLIHQPADWRWNLEPEKSPWYPSLRLFTQEKPGDWDSVIERVRTVLGEEGTKDGAIG